MYKYDKLIMPFILCFHSLHMFEMNWCGVLAPNRPNTMGMKFECITSATSTFSKCYIDVSSTPFSTLVFQ